MCAITGNYGYDEKLLYIVNYTTIVFLRSGPASRCQWGHKTGPGPFETKSQL
jgi:hypothetical protein